MPALRANKSALIITVVVVAAAVVIEVCCHIKQITMGAKCEQCDVTRRCELPRICYRCGCSIA